MTAGDESTTSPTLLDHLRHHPGDQAAWTAFIDRYGRKVYAWARRWGLQDADARDVAQNVLLDVAKQMTNLEYRTSGSFRGWLKTIAYRAWCDNVQSRKRAAGRFTELIDEIAQPEAGEDLLRRFEEECERETFEWAMGRVRLRVQPHTWQAFVRTALEDRPALEVADELGMQLGAVYVARSKVQKMLREEVVRAERADER